MKSGSLLRGRSNNDQYKLLEKLGTGGFGVVWKAEDITTSKIVAIKVFKNEETFTEDQAKEAWENESKHALTLKHPNIIEAFEFNHSKNSDDEDIAYLVMEYGDGGSLQNIISAHQQSGQYLEENDILTLFQQMLLGLEAIHTQTIHRDLKPENILLLNNTLKISDFSLSKFVDEKTRTRTFKGWGTLPYMAPESWVNGAITKATDIYSLGVIMFELVALSLPYDSANEHTLENMHRFNPIPRVSSINPNVSQRLDGIIFKMLQKATQDRYQTATEILQELKHDQIDPPTNGAIGVIEVAKKIIDKQTKEQTESQKQAEEEEIRLQMNNLKRDQFIETVRNVISTINHSIPEKPITLSMGNANDYTIIWDNKDLVKLIINPHIGSMNMTLGGNKIVSHIQAEIRGQARDNEGNNFVLCANDSTDYGTWRVLEITTHPLVARTEIYPLIAGIPLLQELSMIGNAIHTYQREIRDGVEEEITKLIQTAMNYYENPPRTGQGGLQMFRDDWDNGFGF